MTPRDLARIGVMMLKGGMWGGRRVVPAQWIERSTSPMVDIDETRQYDYQWYLGNFGFTVRRHRAGTGHGSNDTGVRSEMAAGGYLYFLGSIWSWP